MVEVEAAPAFDRQVDVDQVVAAGQQADEPGNEEDEALQKCGLPSPDFQQSNPATSVVELNYFSMFRIRFRLLKSYDSGSDFRKVLVPVPVPAPTLEKLRFRFRFQFHIQTVKSKFYNKNLLQNMNEKNVK